jgi:hypothetical protein
MSRAYNLGDRVVLSAVIKRCNPQKQMVVLVMPDGSETPAITFEALEQMEEEARRTIYVPRDTVQQDTPPAGND